MCVASNIAGNLTQSVLLSVLGEFSVGKSASPASVKILFLSKSGPLLPCSASKYPAWPQGDEGSSGSSSGVALYSEWGPRAHLHLDQGPEEVSGIRRWQPGTDTRGPG